MKIASFIILIALLLNHQSCTEKYEDVALGGWDYQHMIEVKNSLSDNDSYYLKAYQSLIMAADNIMEADEIYSVTFKEMTPPSGNKNDYMSMGPYWWPNPDTPDGLPYIRRDGEVNPERNDLDQPEYSRMLNAVRTLSLAWFFSDHNEYAEKAAEVLKVWFLEPETMMNPHLEYAQAIPGRTEGRGIGIIDVMSFYVLVDAIAVLETSGALSAGEISDIRSWFEEYLNWLVESSHGQDMDVYINNHSVAYDVQTSGIAYYLGNEDFVRKKIGDVPENRMNHMIEGDGRQPHELRRTLAYSYSVHNLRNLIVAGEMGLRVGVDIFDYVNPAGGSLRNALDYLIGYVGREEYFPYQQIARWESTENSLGLVIRRAARIYDDDGYRDIWENTFKERLQENQELLVVPGI